MAITDSHTNTIDNICATLNRDTLRSGLSSSVRNYQRTHFNALDATTERINNAILRLRMEDCYVWWQNAYGHPNGVFALRDWPDDQPIFITHPAHGHAGFLHLTTLLDHLEHDWKETAWF